PGHARHHINSISASHADGNHSKTSGIYSVRIGSDHHATRERIVFQHYLVDDTSTWFPETNTIFIRNRREEVKYLAALFVCNVQVFFCTCTGYDKVIAVHRRRYCNLWPT